MRHVLSQPTIVLAVRLAGVALVLLSVFSTAVVIAHAQVSPQQACDADIDQVGTRSTNTYTGSINLSDYTLLVRDFLKKTLANPRSNIDKDPNNLVNLTDYTILTRWFLRSVTCALPTSPATPTPSPQADIPNGGFEKGTFEGWVFHTCCSHSAVLTTSPVRSGKYAAKFTLNKSDPVTEGSKRAEVKLQPVPPGSEYWYGISIFVPSDWVKDTAPEIVFQWHNRPDLDIGEDYKQPALGMRIDGDTYRLVSNWDSKRFTIPDQFEGSKTYLLGQIARGQWTSWKFHVKWSYGSDGILEVWRDGTKVVSQYGPNFYNDTPGPNLKIGVYKFPWYKDPGSSIVSQRVLYFDDIHQIAGSIGPTQW